MGKNQQELLKGLSDAVVEMDEESTVSLAKEVVKEQHDTYQAIEKGLADGMDRAGKLFEEEEYFIPELLMCSDAMYAGLDILKPHLTIEDQTEKHRVVIGVVEGDTHDIGKNLVKIMLETAGFEIYDLGRDVPPKDFVAKAKEVKAQIIAMSTLMTTTMDGMAEVIRLLQQENIRDQFAVMVGGGPISQSFADRIGADGYSKDAAEAARLARRLVKGVAIVHE
ncbi:MAG TPA: cobalamin-binding protein [Firmicutes bacterium]|jgi:dimethylamine corrinoid protein|nr:cobalamin-binding protein [Bacillota bacterium]